MIVIAWSSSFTASHVDASHEKDNSFIEIHVMNHPNPNDDKMIQSQFQSKRFFNFWFCVIFFFFFLVKIRTEMAFSHPKFIYIISIQRCLLAISNWEHHRRLYNVYYRRRFTLFGVLHGVRHLKYDDVDLCLAIFSLFSRSVTNRGPLHCCERCLYVCACAYGISMEYRVQLSHEK